MGCGERVFHPRSGRGREASHVQFIVPIFDAIQLAPVLWHRQNVVGTLQPPRVTKKDGVMQQLQHRSFWEFLKGMDIVFFFVKKLDFQQQVSLFTGGGGEVR